MVIATLVLGAGLALQAVQAATELLPAPTGSHKTGRMSFHWKDSERAELETSARNDRRELMVHIFYPADASASGPRATYVPDADAMRGPWNDAQLARITALRAFSRERAALPRGNARYPVVVFMPGGGMKTLTYHTLLEDLASHGYVVAAIDPPYNARGVRFPDGRVLGALSPGERGWPAPQNQQEEIRHYRERVVHWSRDVSFVIDQLTALDRGRGLRLRGGSTFSAAWASSATRAAGRQPARCACSTSACVAASTWTEPPGVWPSSRRSATARAARSRSSGSRRRCSPSHPPTNSSSEQGARAQSSTRRSSA
jgi:hypothetical protein